MLSGDDARQLDGLTFARTAAAPEANPAGARVARARGPGGEVHDYRHYQPGDDPRSIEWTIHARLGQLVTRTCRADAHLSVHLLVDVSRSMALGSPGKLACAVRVAAALSYVAIRERNAVAIATFGDRLLERVRPAAGRHQLFRVLRMLGDARTQGASAIGHALMDYGSVERGPGLVVVLSDFFDSTDVVQGFRYLLHRGLTPAVVQIVAPEELCPTITGDVELVDVEDSAAAPVLVDAETVAAYQERLASHRRSLETFCVTNGLPWMPVVSSDSFIDVLRACHQAGLLAGQG